MKQVKQYIKIKKINYIPKYKLECVFSDGKIQVVDFYQFLKLSEHPEVKKFLKIKLFTSYKLVEGDLMWGDYDLLFPLSDLYNNNLIH